MTCQNSARSLQPSAAHMGPYDFCGHGTVISLTFCFRTKEDCLSGENIPSGVTNLWDHLYVLNPVYWTKMLLSNMFSKT